MTLSSLFLLYGREAWHTANALQEPVYFLSGLYFPIRSLGALGSVAAGILPLTLGTDAIRQVLLGPAAHGLLPLCARGTGARRLRRAVHCTRSRVARLPRGTLEARGEADAAMAMTAASIRAVADDVVRARAHRSVVGLAGRGQLGRPGAVHHLRARAPARHRAHPDRHVPHRARTRRRVERVRGFLCRERVSCVREHGARRAWLGGVRGARGVRDVEVRLRQPGRDVHLPGRPLVGEVRARQHQRHRDAYRRLVPARRPLGLGARPVVARSPPAWPPGSRPRSSSASCSLAGR